ncbi:MAG TPA: pitrilysin family protein [Candidatus Hydrogenedentes bacterium]|nr:pitrilysin family protein [Candidatus Hydrogenedentota bacterium]
MQPEKDLLYTDNAVARKLDNGMTVTLERLPYLHSATAGVWVKTGSANEQPDQAGISHFLEHLFFKGTKTRTARQIMEPIESKGGHLNAFTSREYTCLYIKTLDKHLAAGIEVLADVIKNSTFCDLDKERNVVLEEIASIEDVPEDYAHDLLSARLWPNHPLGWPVSGRVESVANITIKDVQSYYKAWYRPRNMYFSIAGNFDESAVLEQVDREFGGLPPSPSHKHSGPPEFAPGIEIVERDIAQNHLCMAFPGPTVSDERRYVYDILSSALGGGSTSRLFERIREEEGLAYSIYSFHSCFFTAGMFGIYAAVAPENFDRTLGLIFEEIGKFRAKPIPETELENNREHLKGSMLMSLESTFNRMSRMAKSMIYYKRLLGLSEIIGALDAVTVDDLHQVAVEIFRPERCTMLVLGPKPATPLEGIPL